jgi:hypothetical protein
VILLLPLVVVVLLVGVRELRARLASGGDTLLAGPPAWSRANARPVPDRARAVVALARAEARQMLLHPAVVGGLLLALLAVGASSKATGFDRYVALTGGAPLGLYLPPLAFFAANLCASRTRRARAGEVFDATAATPADRTLALCLAAFGPAVAAAAVVALAYAYFRLTGPALPPAPLFWEVLALPLAVLGGGLLGVLVARWLPFRGGALAVFAALVVASAWAGQFWPMLVTLTEFADFQDDGGYRLVTDNPSGAHAAYLLGLDVMAAVGALLAHRGHRRLLLGVGAVATGGTVWAALLAA